MFTKTAIQAAAQTLRNDSAGNAKATMTDIDLAARVFKQNDVGRIVQSLIDPTHPSWSFET